MTGDENALHAYHDRELRGLARWWFERRLARSPELQRELENLRQLRALAREADRTADTPDLWQGIARRLPALDAQPAGGGAEAEPARWLEPLGALSAAAFTAALVFVLWSSDTADSSVVRWIDSGDRNVVVLEDDDEVTIIWVLGEAAAGAAQGGGA